MVNITALLESGPKPIWTHDNKIYEHFQDWKQEVELILSYLPWQKLLFKAMDIKKGKFCIYEEINFTR